MNDTNGKRAMAVCILKVLEDHSDIDQPLTSTDITKYLESDYGLHAARNTIKSNINTLIDIGYPISTFADNGRGNYLERESIFDDEEIRVLVDSVLTSRFIPEKQAKDLIKRLIKMASKNLALRTKHIHPINEWNHRRNKQFFYNLACISDAIGEKKQVEFYYNIITPEGKLEHKTDRIHRVHPFEIACNNGQYYLICSLGYYDNLLHYRLDRMTDIKKREKNARSIKTIPGYEKGLKLAKYAAEHHFMFGGPTTLVKLKMPVERAGDVLDAFGNRARMKDLKDGFMEVTVKAAPEGIKYFALQFGGNCEVLEPVALIKEIHNDILSVENKYK